MVSIPCSHSTKATPKRGACIKGTINISAEIAAELERLTAIQ
jgi:hypothetical protein